MLRITTKESPTTITLVLEGKCRGPWVDELEQCWNRATVSASGRKLRVDLKKVAFVDERGRELLAEMYAAGVDLRAVGLMMTSLVEEIAARFARTASQRLRSEWGIRRENRPEKYRVGRISKEV